MKPARRPTRCMRSAAGIEASAEPTTNAVTGTVASPT